MASLVATNDDLFMAGGVGTAAGAAVYKFYFNEEQKMEFARRSSIGHAGAEAMMVFGLAGIATTALALQLSRGG